MPAKLKPIKFKIHQVRLKRASGKVDSTYKIEVLQKRWFGWCHKAWVDYRGITRTYEPSTRASSFFHPHDFERAIKDVEQYYQVEESRKVVSTEKTDYIYEKNS